MAAQGDGDEDRRGDKSRDRGIVAHKNHAIINRPSSESDGTQFLQ